MNSLRIAILPFLACSSLLTAAEYEKAAKPKPEFQYKTDGISIPAARADEPKVKAFNASTVKAAATYLDNGAICWVREKTCINCHTTGPYLSERPALSKLLGKPNEEILADFVKGVPATLKPSLETEKNGLKYHSGSWTAIWRSLGLAEWDKHVTGSLSEHTAQSLHDMMLKQSPNGAFVSFGEVEIPHITTDFELTLQAARAVTAAPGWLAGLKDADLLARIEKMKSYLRNAKPKNDFDQVLRLQLGSYFPELVTADQRRSAQTLLSSKQHADGGWCIRDFSAVNDWHFTMSETVLKLIANLPDAAKPESDAYMTALGIVLLRQSDVPASDERILRALVWLKREQRVSGRWWMYSLYRGNYNYITYIATTQALKALAMCDELPQTGAE